MAPRVSKLVDALLAGIIGFIMAAVLGGLGCLVIFTLGWWSLLPASVGLVLAWGVLETE